MSTPQSVWIEAGDTALALVSVGGAPPKLAWFGPRLDPRSGSTELAAVADVAVPHGALDAGEAFDLLPEGGRGAFASPGLSVARGGVEIVTQLQLVALEASAAAASVRLADEIAGLEVELRIELHATGVAQFRSRLVNRGPSALGVGFLAAATLPLAHDEAMTFAGRWAGEFAPARTRVAAGALVQENRTGRTSHHAPPFWVVGEVGFGEAAGEVLGLHLAWSGNHVGRIERLRDGRLMFQAGELLAPGEVELAPGEAYASPVLHAAWSDRGLNGLSARLHPYVRKAILGGRLQRRPRPVVLNTWEAVYFDHAPEALRGLANAAAAVGVERFVLDDGWFRGRRDDTAGLGDWTPDPQVYPQGLGPLIAHVRALGMEFGLWVEPEMANADSDLARTHPQWLLGEAGREQPLGRGQYVVDLAQPAAAQHLFEALDTLLRENDIAYLKWDMNRDLVHARSGGRPSTHRQTAAVYALIDRLRAAHPQVEIESCASGGGRIDYEILRRTDRVWASDGIDPFDRQPMQRALSIFLPPELIGSHVGAARAHTTGRTASMRLRALTAFFGAFGVEADVRAMGEAERGELAGWIARYKAWRPLLHGGRQARLAHPDPGLLAMAVIGPDEALVGLAQLETPRHAIPAPLRIPGLAEGAWRVLREDDARAWRRRMKRGPAAAMGEAPPLTAALLARAGLPLPVLQAGEVALFRLVRDAVG